MTKTQYNSFLTKSLASLKIFHDNEQLSLFVGAGITMDSGLPNWSKLIEDFKKELDIKEKDYLKIAQFYHLHYGENMYYKKLLDRFNLETKQPNKLINTIVNLGCKYIVTTNWDDLIEKSIVLNGKFYDVVKKDNDFSKLGINTNTLIKMHGDLHERNIVFKESDYLSYSDNFSLTELFVKSIFVRNVILFVGYSVSDFNVKQLINWVQNRSKQTLPIYFLESKKEFDYLEFEYFKLKNIFVLYIKDIYEDVNEVLQSINIQAQSINTEQSKKSFLESVYDVLKPFESYRYVSGFDIASTLQKAFSLYGINEIFYLGWGESSIFIQRKEIIKNLKTLSDFKKDKELSEIAKKIRNIFLKSGVSSIVEFDTHKLLCKFSITSMIENDFLYFDKKTIEQKLYKKENDDLEKSYLQYKLENYFESYRTLEKVTFKAFTKKDYVKYFFGEFNKKQFCSVLRFREKQYFDKSQDAIEAICTKNHQIELSDIYHQLPKTIQSTIKPLLSLERFVEGKQNYISNKLEDIKNKGKNRLDNVAQELDIFTSDIIANINNNYLMIDHFMYKTYKNIFESIVYEYENSKVNFILYKFIYCAIMGYASWKDLTMFLFEKKSLRLDEQNSLTPIHKKVYENLLDPYIDQNDLHDIYEQYFTNYFTVLMYSELADDEVEYLAKSILTILKKRNMQWEDYELIDMFFQKYAQKIDYNIQKEILELFLDKFICGRFNFYDVKIINGVSFFDNIFEVMKAKNLKIDKYKIESYIEQIKHWDTRTKFNIYSYFILGLYSVADEGLKDNIRKELLVLAEELKNYKQEESSNTLENISFEIGKGKYLYFEYLLILSLHEIRNFEEEIALLEYIKNYKEWCNCFSEIHYLVKRLQDKSKDKDYLKSIEDEILKTRGK